MIISRTPHRISLLGGGSDYPQSIELIDGLCVGGTINHYSYVMARFLPQFHAHKSRFVYSDIECVQAHTEIKHRAIKATLEYLACDHGIEVFHAADLPSHSGTGSSSSFVVGLLNAVASLNGRLMLPEELANAAIHVEQVLMGDTVGCQDQVFAGNGGLGYIQFKKTGISYYPLVLEQHEIQALENHLLLFYTKMPRVSGEVAKTYVNTFKKDVQYTMVRLAEQGIQAVYKGDYERLGWLVDQSWRIKSRLSQAVSNNIIADIYNKARAEGAWGGKLTGAGSGGCVLLVCPIDKREKVIHTMTELGLVHIPFQFDFDGSRIIYARK